MINKLLKKEYDDKLNEISKRLKLPSGANNIYTLTYLPFFEIKELTLKQKGILIHLFIRGGSNRIVFKSIVKLATTLNIERTVYLRNISKLESLNYLKRFEQKIQIDKRKLPSIIYLYPINDKTGLPIKSNQEEIDLSLNVAKEYLNKYSKYIISIEEKYNADTEEEIEIDDIRDDLLPNDIEQLLNQNIFIPAYIAFMENPLLTINDKVIYLYLLLRSGQLNIFFESKSNISNKLHISTKSLNTSLQNLEKYLYIRKFKRYKDNGNISSDVLYINPYDHFTGLPEINDDIMYLKLEKSKELYFKDYVIKESIPKFTYKEKDETFDASIKSLLLQDSNITQIYYDTFIVCSNFSIDENKNNINIVFNIPEYLSSFKSTIYDTLNELVLKYSKAILKTSPHQFILNVQDIKKDSSL